ncbi:Uncharacterised protein [Vibrio cholerae]|nr:Uncharacterised protein [Vibrio cholerae]
MGHAHRITLHVKHLHNDFIEVAFNAASGAVDIE